MNINPFELLKNAKEIQGQLNNIKEEVKNLKATGSSGGGIVTVTVGGDMQIQAIKLDPIADGDIFTHKSEFTEIDIFATLGTRRNKGQGRDPFLVLRHLIVKSQKLGKRGIGVLHPNQCG